MGERRNEPFAPAVELPRKPAAERIERLAPLAVRLGVDQLGQALDRRQVHAPGIEGAPGELAGLCRAQAALAHQRRLHRVHHDRRAVQVQFGRILAGEARRARKPDRKPPVQQLAAFRVADGAQHRPARLRQRARKRRQRLPRGRPRQAQHRDAGAAGRRRLGEDRVGPVRQASGSSMSRDTRPPPFRWVSRISSISASFS